MTKSKLTPIDQRRALQLQIAQLDLGRAQAVVDIMARPEMLKAAEDLRALHDPSAPQGSPHSDVNALVSRMLDAMDNVPPIAENLVVTLETVADPEAAEARARAQGEAEAAADGAAPEPAQ